MFNTHVRDNLNWLSKDAGWVQATLQSGWTHYDTTTFGPVRSRRVGPWTCIQGLAAGTTPGTSVVIFTLPLGYGPDRQTFFPGANSLQTPHTFYVNPDRTVYVENVLGLNQTYSWFSFSCIFPTNLGT